MGARVERRKPDRDEAIARLHDLLVRGARSEAHRRSSQLRIDGPEVDDLVHQAADDAPLAIVAKLDRFRGHSLFTTWAFKFVVHEVSTNSAAISGAARPLRWGRRSGNDFPIVSD